MSTETNIYKAKPREITRMVARAIDAGLVPYIQSSPGMGKSSIVRFLAEKANLKVIDHRLSTSAPEDLSGLPMFNTDGTASFAPFKDLFPIAGTPVPEGFTGWLLFLDEFNSAEAGVQKACYKLILDRMVGQHPLHEQVHMVLAGNLDTDRAFTSPLNTAMQSRVVHLEMEIDYNTWQQDVAFPQNYDERIIAFLAQYPSKLMNFQPDHKEKTFGCPRTWEFMNKLIKGNTIDVADTPLYAGIVGAGLGVDFVQFTQVYSTLVTLRDIIANPDHCRIPDDRSAMYATICHLLEKATSDNLKTLDVYVRRFQMTFQILFYRSLIARYPQLRRHETVINAITTLGTQLA